MNYKILYLALIVLPFVGCKNDEPSKDETSKTDKFSITYSLVSGFARYSLIADINQSGTLKIEEVSLLSDTKSNSDYSLTSEELGSVKQQLEKLAKIDMKDSYGFEQPLTIVDAPTIKIKYTTITKTDSTAFYTPQKSEIPNELDILVNTIEKIMAAREAN